MKAESFMQQLRMFVAGVARLTAEEYLADMAQTSSSHILNFQGTTDKKKGKGTNRRLKPAHEIHRFALLKAKKNKTPSRSSALSVLSSSESESSAVLLHTVHPTQPQACPVARAPVLIENPTEIRPPGRPRTNPNGDRDLAQQLIEHFVQRQNNQKKLAGMDPAEIQQSTTEWLDFKLAKGSGSLANQIYNQGAGALSAAVQALQLHAPFSNASMDLGQMLEKKVIAAYFDGKDVRLTFPGVVPHKNPKLGVFSPDCVAYIGGKCVLVEVKTSIHQATKKIQKKHADQVQLGIWACEADEAMLLYYQVEQNQGETISFDRITVYPHIKPDDSWRAHYKIKGEEFYDAHLSWFHGDLADTRTVDRARRVLELLIDKRSKKSKWITDRKNWKARPSERPARKRRHMHPDFTYDDARTNDQ